MEHCPEHETLLVDIAIIKEKVVAVDNRINGSIDDIKKHIEHGMGWRMAICGVAVGLIMQIIVLSSMWGRLTKLVEVNTGRITEIEKIHPRSNGAYENVDSNGKAK